MHRHCMRGECGVETPTAQFVCDWHNASGLAFGLTSMLCWCLMLLSPFPVLALLFPLGGECAAHFKPALPCPALPWLGLAWVVTTRMDGWMSWRKRKPVNQSIRSFELKWNSSRTYTSLSLVTIINLDVCVREGRIFFFFFPISSAEEDAGLNASPSPTLYVCNVHRGCEEKEEERGVDDNKRWLVMREGGERKR